MTIPVRFNGIRTVDAGVPAVNTFGMVSSIGETVSKGIDDVREAKLKEARAKVLMEAGQDGADYDSIGRRLIAAGEVNSGLGFLKLGQEEKSRKTQAAADAQAFGLAYGREGNTPSYGTTSGTPRANIDNNTVHVAETEEDVQRLERATGQYVAPDLDKVVRTVYGEASGEGIIGQQAVASVIANRARQSGMTPTDVVLAKGQFEPWSDPAARARMESLDPNSPEYKQLAAIVEPALKGQLADPTGGATHFYAPKAQAALGRSAPSWDDGTGRDIGNHRFFNHGYGPQGKVQVAQADVPAPDAQPAQGFAIPGQAQSPVIANLERALANPNLSDGARRALQSRLDREYKRADEAQKPQEWQSFEHNGTRYSWNPRTNETQVLVPGQGQAGYRPMTSEERKAFGLPGETGGYIGPDGKPGALPGTTRITNNMSGEKGEVEYDKTVGKNYGETFIELQKAGRSAISTKNTLALMERLTKDPNFYSGFGAERQMMLNKALASLGITEPKVNAPNEVFTSLVNDVVLGKLGGSLGAGVSNADTGFLQATAPNLANTKEGNRLLIAITGKMVDRQQQIAQMAREYAKANGGRIDAGFDDLLDQFAQQNPLFTDEDYKAAQAAMNGEPIPTLQPGSRENPAIKIPESMTPDQVRKRYPSGTRIILPDGTEGVVP